MNEKVQLAWLEHIVENTESAVVVVDSKRIVRFANTRALDMVEAKSVNEVLGESYTSFLSAFTLQDSEGNYLTPESYPSTEAFSKGKIVRDIVIEQSKGAMHRWVRVTCVPICNEKSEITFVIIYYRDISHRKLNDDKLTFLIENSKILSITSDFHTRLLEKARHAVPKLADWCTVNVVNANNTLSRIAIVHRDPAKIPLVEELVNLSEKEATPHSGIYHVLKTGKSQFTPEVVIDFSSEKTSASWAKLVAELKVCSSMIIPIKSDEKVLGILSLAYADSGRHYTRDDLEFFEDFCHHLGILFENARLFDEIKNKDKAKDAFLATLSHELRNPLAPIKSSLELLSIKSTDPSFTEELSLIDHQFSHLTKLLGELLDITRYSQGKITLDQKKIDISALVRRIADTHRPLMQSKNISLQTTFPKNTLFVFADGTRIEQAIRNILHNAVKFTPQGGSVDIHLYADGKNISIEISDNGEGIDQVDLAHIFEGSPSYIGKTEHPQKGLGIGLVLVREIMRLHSGLVHAKSDGLGFGSTFVIELPQIDYAGNSAANSEEV